MERQCLLVLVYLDFGHLGFEEAGPAMHQRVVWLPVAHAVVNKPVPRNEGWVVTEVWHATRSKGGERGNEHWEFTP